MRFIDHKKYFNARSLNDSYFRSHLEIFHHANLFARSMHFNPSLPSNAPIQQNSFALLKPSHSYPPQHPKLCRSALVPPAVSIISPRLVGFVVKRRAVSAV